MKGPPYGPLPVRPHPMNEPLALGLRRLEGIQEQDELERLSKQSAIPLNRRGAFSTEVLDLSSASLASTAGVQVDRTGFGLLYRRQGSSPGGRLLLNIGGRIEDVRPGDYFQGYFDSFQVFRNTGSANVGEAQLLIFTQPDAFYWEAPVAVGQQTPVYLLGSSSSFVTVAENTQPSGAAPTGSFDPTGYRNLRLEIDGQAANTLTTVDLIPWVRDPNSALWFEQGTERISIPDSDSTAYRYRVVNVPVIGNGLMFFEIRNLLPAGQTQLGFNVQGLS